MLVFRRLEIGCFGRSRGSGDDGHRTVRRSKDRGGESTGHSVFLLLRCSTLSLLLLLLSFRSATRSTTAIAEQRPLIFGNECAAAHRETQWEHSTIVSRFDVSLCDDDNNNDDAIIGILAQTKGRRTGVRDMKKTK